MSKTTATQFAHGQILTEVASASAKADAPSAPEWIKILPAGEVTTRDGRRYTFDPEALAARFNADGIDIPIDLDHGISKNQKADAVGWIKETAPKPDGLYGRVDWLEAGLNVLASKSRRFTSPTFHHTKTGVATWLHSVALVAAPALAMPALAHAQPEPKDDTMNATAEALGLKGDAEEAACLSALADLKASTVDKKVHDETLANLETVSTELSGLKAEIRQKDVDDLLEGALAEKKIVPAQRDHYASLCASDEGLDQVKALLSATAKGLAASGLDDTTAPDTDKADDPADLSARAQAYQAEQADKGITVDIATAVNHVKGAGA